MLYTFRCHGSHVRMESEAGGLIRQVGGLIDLHMYYVIEAKNKELDIILVFTCWFILPRL